MRTYQYISLLVVAVVVSVVVGMRLGRNEAAPAAPSAAPGSANAECCAAPSLTGQDTAPAPAIPTGSGRSCLVELGSNECESCRKMKLVMDALAPKLAGKVDVVQVDTDVNHSASLRWHLRIIPTQILVAADGSELYRHEGYIAEAELLEALRPEGLGKGKGAG
jgi:thioredoxin 1